MVLKPSVTSIVVSRLLSAKVQTVSLQESIVQQSKDVHNGSCTCGPPLTSVLEFVSVLACVLPKRTLLQDVVSRLL